VSDFTVTVETGIQLHEQFEKYPGAIARLENEEKGQFGPQVKWIFVLDADKGQGENGQDRETWHWTPRKVTSKNKTGKLLAQLTGRAIELGEAYDLTKFIGTRVNVIFEHKQSGDKTVEAVFAVQPI
jgi:hypothetical protein